MRASKILSIGVSLLCSPFALSTSEPKPSSISVLFPREHQVVSPKAYILVGNRKTTFDDLKTNKQYLGNIQLINDQGIPLALTATQNGLKPKQPLSPGNHQVLLSPCQECEATSVSFRVSSLVTPAKLVKPDVFRWNLYRFHRAWNHCEHEWCVTPRTWQEENIRDYISVEVKPSLLISETSFIRYDVGFIPSEEDLKKYTFENAALPVPELLNTQSFEHTPCPQKFTYQWSTPDINTRCIGLIAYDGYGNKIGPIAQCQPHTIKRGDEDAIQEIIGKKDPWYILR